MPQLNRDQETLYPPGKLHLVFLATSGLLVASIVWMLAGDFVRDWKSVQGDYFRREAGLLQVEREQRDADARGTDEAAAALKDLGAKIQAEQRRLDEPAQAAALEKMRTDLAEQKLQVVEAETQIKAVKGQYAERRFAYEMAVKEGHAEEAKALLARVTKLGGEQKTFEDRRLAALARQNRLEGEIERATRPLKDLQKARDEKLEAVTKATRAYEDSHGKTTEAQWRNLPIADIVAPTIKVEKVVLDHIHDDFNFATSPKVDMCMTCHRGIDRDVVTEKRVRVSLTRYLESRFGEKAWTALTTERKGEEPAAFAERTAAWTERLAPGRLRAWLSGAPKLTDAFSEEKIEKALGGPDAAAAWRDRTLGGKSLEEGGQDLLAPFAIRPVEWAHPHLDLMVGSKSPHKMEAFGCTTCHEGVGRRLDFVRAAHSPESHEEEERWKHEHSWTEPEFVLFPMVPVRYAQGQCLKCHKPALEFRPTFEPLARWGEVERTVDDKKVMQTVRLDAPKPVDSPHWAAVDGRWRPEILERGRTAMREHGCTACHKISDFNGNPGWPLASSGTPSADFSTPAPGAVTAYGEAKVGPDLTHVKDKTTKAWAVRWIENPTSFKLDTRMPAFYRHRLHDDRYNAILGPDGKPQDVTVMLDPNDRDRAGIDVETLALATFLAEGQQGSRADKYPAPPAGDVEAGRKLFYSVGCYACHLGPDDREGSGLPEATLRRFDRREGLPPGPRLQGLGSKLKAPFLYEWLREPRHYNSVTRMPAVPWRDETGPDGKTVVRSGDQQRADVVAYVLSSKDAAFEERMKTIPDPANERWTSAHEAQLKTFWIEWYGKSRPDPADPTHKLTLAAEDAAADADALYRTNIAKMLSDVGRRLVGFRGCFGCHNIQGYESEQPIGKDLSEEGTQDLHKFDRGILDHHQLAHTRWDWIEAKLREPRIFDKGRFKPVFQDKLRMPKLNLRADEREAITAVVLGLVKEPIKAKAIYRPDDTMRKIAAGRAVIERYGCNQCHTIENRLGVLTGEQQDRGLELALLPPNLFSQGNRTKPDWLFKFLKSPHVLRPGVIQRMPMFRFTDAEVVALVDYFQAVAGRKSRFETDLEDHPLDATPYPEPITIQVPGKDADGNTVNRDLVVRNRIEETKALFDTLNCVKCHLPKGMPGADPTEAAVAPPFTLARERLQRAWMLDLVQDPPRQILGTKMTQFWPKRRRAKPGETLDVTYPQFLLGTRGHEGITKDMVGDTQMADIVRYILWHYEMPKQAPAAQPGN